MNNTLRETLKDVLTDMLENFAFMFEDLEDPEDPDRSEQNNGKYFQVTMSFSGIDKGLISLTMPEQLSLELAANVLGKECENISDEEGIDALKELLNITSGKITYILYGEKPVIDLSIPVLHPISKEKWLNLCNDPANLKLLVEDKTLLAHLELKRQETITS